MIQNLHWCFLRFHLLAEVYSCAETLSNMTPDFSPFHFLFGLCHAVLTFEVRVDTDTYLKLETSVLLFDYNKDLGVIINLKVWDNIEIYLEIALNKLWRTVKCMRVLKVCCRHYIFAWKVSCVLCVLNRVGMSNRSNRGSI